MSYFQGFWENLFGGLRSWFWYVVKWIAGYGQSTLASLLDLVGGALPVGMGAYVATVKPYIEVVNGWVPLDLGAALVVSYWSIRLVVWGMRFALKFVPGVG